MEKVLFRKNFVWNILGSTFNAFNSLFLMIIVTRINGIDDGGIFTLAFSFACLIFTIGIYAGRTFQVTDNQEYSDRDYLFHRFLSVLLMMAIGIVFILIQPYSTEKMLIMFLLCLWKAQEAFCDTIYGVFQVNGNLYKAGFSMFIKSICCIIVFLIVDLIYANLVISCVSLNIVWLLLFFIYDLPNCKSQFDKQKLVLSHSFKLFKRGLFAFLFTFLTIYIVNAPKYAMDTIVSNDIQAIFGIILMPATILSLCGQYLLNPYLNHLKEAFNANDKNAFHKIINKIVCLLFLFGALAIILMYYIGVPIMSFVYNVNLSPYRWEMVVILCGGILYAMGLVFSAALTTLRHTFIQFVINAIASIIGLIGSYWLIRNYELQGAVGIYLIIMLCQSGLYYIFYKSIVNKTFAHMSKKNEEIV